MTSAADPSRLSILLELMSDWMTVDDEEQLLAALPRLKWVFNFRTCGLILRTEAAPESERLITFEDDRPCARPAAEVQPEILATLRRTLTTRSPETSPAGASMVTCYPLVTAGRLHGAIGFRGQDRSALSARDGRLMHFTTGCLAGTLDRLAAREAERVAHRRKDEFLAILGHELRNPLAPIRTALELSKLRGAPPPEYAVIARQVDHMVRLVDDLLDVSRITRGKLELKRRPLELSQVVGRALEMARPLIERRQQRLELEVPPTGLLIDGDEHRLAQVVSNLLLNASKYSDVGRRIRLAAEAAPARLRIRVIDEGIGIAPETLPRIFDLFVQERQPIDRGAGGLGLGLSIVRSVVNLHGGQVRAHSAGLGLGSEFIVELPRLVARAAEAAPPPPPKPSPPSRGRRVLVVDDNGDVRDSIGDLLSMLGFSVSVASDGPEALGLAAVTPPDIAILDVGLPVMDGYALAGRLRALHSAKPELHLIALTGYGQDEDRRRSFEAGFQLHLVKPVDIGTLTNALES
jgi:signal transduction histidine kinase